MKKGIPILRLSSVKNAAASEYGAVFVMQIGGRLKTAKSTTAGAPDYDDWRLNGDILVYNRVLESAFEILFYGNKGRQEKPAFPVKG